MRTGCIVFIVLTVVTCRALAQPGPPREISVASQRPPILVGVGLDQRLGQQIPLDLLFRNERGRPVPLGRYFGDKPVILTLVYYDCPMLCPQVLTDLVGILRALPFTAGKEFTVVTVSFDPHETAALASTKKAGYIARYGRQDAAAGWHFLTGDQASIERLTRAVGFRYAYDEHVDQYAHPTGVMLLTPQGRLARYFYGVDYSARDVRLGLVEASSDRIGSPVDQVLLFCYHYDPASGKYSLLTLNLVRLAGIATVIGLAAFILAAARRDRKNYS